MSHRSDALPPSGSACPNCGAPVTGAWCASCGQKWGPINPTWHELAHEARHEFLHLDGKIFRTLRLLLTRPGELTAEQLRGRRVRYIGPLRLYLTTSVLFFLLAAAIPNVDLKPSVSLPAGAPAAAVEMPAVEMPVSNGLIGRIRAGQRMAMAHADTFSADLVHEFPKVMFLLVPVFAVALQLVYRRQRWHYAAFLYFSLHLHAALFVVMALTLPLQTFASDITLTVAEGLALLAVFVYLVFALRRVFGGTWEATILRAIVATALNACAFAVGIVILVLATLYALGSPGYHG